MFMDKQFVEYKSKNKNATIVLLQSLMSTDQLSNMGLKTMANEFPVMNNLVIKSDNVFPAIDW